MATWPKKYNRPSLIVFSTTATIGSSGYNSPDDLVTSDHGRSDLQVKTDRIETAGRMVDGTYRSHFVAQKYEFSWQWDSIPSRKFTDSENTADGYAGALEIIDFLNTNKGKAFYIKLVFDNAVASYPAQYPEKAYRVMIKDYNYAVKGRGKNFDLMDVSVDLVEV